MRKCLLYKTVIVLLIVFGSFQSTAYPQIKTYAEKVLLNTDRALYISGEEISFSACLLSDSLAAELQSRILYCEVITPDGNKVTGNKFLLNHGHAAGSILLPHDLVSGYYYLRAYTRFMRNSGPSSYSYCLLKIINPVTTTVLNHGTSDSVLLKQYFKEIPALAVSLQLDKTLYHYRDTVNLRISGIKDDSFVAGYTLAVVPETSVMQFAVKVPTDLKYRPNKPFYPENKGLTLTGNLSNTKTGKPCPAERVNLVIIGKGKDFMAVNTDQNSNFYFALPDYTGFRDLLLSIDTRKNDSLKIQVDNDFCPVQFKLPSPVFSLNDNEKATILKMAVNEKLSTAFPQDSIVSDDFNPDFNRAFYGTPDEVLLLDQYVQLTSLEEYFNELAMYAKVRKSKGKPYFKVIGPQEDINKYEPLVLVDWVAIDDPARILAISAQNVARIEIINRVYVKGANFYGGIISIISKNGDFAGIELPAASLFINYRFLSESEAVPSPQKNPNFPDSRNTLFWEPDLHLLQGSDNKFNFTTGDNPGNYHIVLRAIYKDGGLKEYVTPINVTR